MIEGRAASVRERALMGVWGREVHITDGRWKYARTGRKERAALHVVEPLVTKRT